MPERLRPDARRATASAMRWLYLFGAILAGTLATAIVVGLVSGWSFEDWQYLDWTLVIAGPIAGLLLYAQRREVGIAIVPVVLSGAIWFAMTVLFLSFPGWFLIDVAAFAVYAGTAFLLYQGAPQ